MTELLRFSWAQWRLEPETGMEDAYKWLFHATLGGEHAITSAEGPRRWMEREWKTLTAPRPGEKMIQPLRPDGKIVRLNLRPYKARGGGPEAILTAFIASAKSFKAEKSAFRIVWREFGATLTHEEFRPHLTRANWGTLEKETAALDYPAIDHSAPFVRQYAPAYRVLTGDAAKRLTATLAAVWETA